MRTAGTGGLVLVALLVSGRCSAEGTARSPDLPPDPPLPSGHYVFQQRFAEHPAMGGGPVEVTITGTRVVVTQRGGSAGFPAGVLAEGELAWHAGSGQWIIARSAQDLSAPEVGGCTDGPEVLDLADRVYWTC